VSDLPAGRITLVCFGMDVVRQEVHDVLVDRNDVVIVMERPGRLAGRVVDDATGAPLTKFTIRFVEPELKAGEQRGGGYGVEWLNGLVFEDANGGWGTDTERFESGAVFGVEVSADGYGPVVQRRAIASPEPNPDALVLRLGKAARITGRIVDRRSGNGIEELASLCSTTTIRSAGEIRSSAAEWQLARATAGRSPSKACPPARSRSSFVTRSGR
jgi:hypothetical protein